jgi:hypothetical protein
MFLKFKKLSIFKKAFKIQKLSKFQKSLQVHKIQAISTQILSFPSKTKHFSESEDKHKVYSPGKTSHRT